MIFMLKDSVIDAFYGYESWLRDVIDNQFNNPIFIAGAVGAVIGLFGVLVFRKWLRVVCWVLMAAAICLMAYSC